jgi:fatty-acyl-CoA synthase
MVSIEEVPSVYAHGLNKVRANYQPLTPLSFIDWAADVFGDRIGCIYGSKRLTWRQVRGRCRCLASALRRCGVRPGDTVSVLLPNVPAMLEAHFGVPMAGAVLNAINYRLDPATIAFILDHAESKVLITDTAFAPLVRPALEQLGRYVLVVDAVDVEEDGPEPPGEALGQLTYEELLDQGDPDCPPVLPEDEWQPVSLCYTSGTTGNPKGVVYHHRGAHLNALSNALLFGVRPESVYLWTLPMFHCNGWTFTWAVTAVGGTHVCLRRVEPGQIFSQITTEKVTHLCGAPIVLNMLANGTSDRLPHRVRVLTGGAAPPSAIIEAMEARGFDVHHAYGLTEVYGPATYGVPQADWSELPVSARASKIARQGVRTPVMPEMQVADPATMQPVPRDGTTIGEIMLRGHTVMAGYLKNPTATAAAFAGDWYHTGDLAVVHPDGYAEVKDRAKDIIISGGENISSLEVEEVLYRHPAIMEAAVVARPDLYWGEVPCAFLMLKPDAEEPSSPELTAWLKRNLAGYKVPRRFVFGPLPKTSTGKIQKNELRERAKLLD